MTVLIVVAMFLLFVGIDYLIRTRQAHAGARAEVRIPVPEPAAQVQPVWVAGYQLPEGIFYHPGHTWARIVDQETVLVGMDDFARRLLVPATGVKPPSAGSWLRQGGGSFRVHVNGRTAEFVSPVDGEVKEVNPALQGQPNLATDDPYGRGWVLKVRPSDLAANLRNLLSGTLARRWMEDARERLDVQMTALSGTVLQDGGRPAADFARHLSHEDWTRLVREFLLT